MQALILLDPYLSVLEDSALFLRFIDVETSSPVYQLNKKSVLLQAFLIRIKRDHGSIDLEWLRYVPRAKAK